MKRLFDIVISAVGLLCTSVVLLPAMFLIWRQDGFSPFYIAARTGKDDRPFRMVKLRSMIKNADKTGVDSTSAGDNRVTAVGRFVRKYKLDELTQLWNVLKGEMSLVGPRPNVKRETDLYTREEKKLLSVRPGITDFASIVFSDEGDILNGKADPDIAYNQLIRPGKSKLGLFYVANSSIRLDLQLIGLTAVASVSRASALRGVSDILTRMGAPTDLIDLARRDTPLVPAPPPGATGIVTTRDQVVS
ncbi:sugar transferase [Nitrobacter sp. TKz-YC02]|uniref:sugar transferase n=1 Tax=Nitrobacter sp. TKz-YC02 TaxID=3398704 RepID=UPI003CEE3E84